ncbi:hypothetical protein Q3E60_08660 [Enterococcus faecium]|nr:hypothetical protein [Enterococcus faecium]
MLNRRNSKSDYGWFPGTSTQLLSLIKFQKLEAVKQEVDHFSL